MSSLNIVTFSWCFGFRQAVTLNQYFLIDYIYTHARIYINLFAKCVVFATAYENFNIIVLLLKRIA